MNEITSQILIPREHASLPGHFPGQPIVPGVVLLDAVLGAIQTACTSSLRLAAIVSTKFLRAVEPETRLDLQVTFGATAPLTWKARFVGKHDGVTVLEGSFLLTDESVRGDQ